MPLFPGLPGIYAVTYNVPAGPIGGGADDTTAVQAALNAAGICSLPPNKPYQITNLQMTNGGYLKGYGAGGSGVTVPQTQRSTLQQTVNGNATPAIVIPQGASHWIIEDLEIDGQWTSQPTNTTTGVLVQATDYVAGEECQGLLRNTYIHGGKGASNVYLGQGRRAITVIDAKWHDSSGIVLHVAGSDHRFFGILVSSAQGAENIRYAGSNCDFYSLSCYDATSVGFLVDTNATDLTITGGSIDTNGAQGFYVGNTGNSAIVLDGVCIRSNSTSANGSYANVQVSAGSGAGLIFSNCYGGPLSSGVVNKASWDVLLSANAPLPIVRNWTPSPAAALVNGAFSWNQVQDASFTWAPFQGTAVMSITANRTISLPTGCLTGDVASICRTDVSANTLTVQAGTGATLIGGSTTVATQSAKRFICVSSTTWMPF